MDNYNSQRKLIHRWYYTSCRSSQLKMGGLSHKRARARSYKKVTRHRKSEIKKRDVKSMMIHPVLKEKWDNKKTLTANMASIDILDFSRLLPSEKDIKVAHPPINCEREERLISNLFKRYGSNVAAWSRDKRLNPFQWTVSQCQKRLEVWETNARFVKPDSE